MAITDAQQAKQIMMKKGGPVVQAGVKNYKPSKMVTVPKVAKSSPTHPTAKLAYITDAEKKLLIKKNLHGSLKGKPNRGPGGIPSLQGDFGPGGKGSYSEAGPDVSGRKDTGTGDYRVTDRKAQQEYDRNRKAREKAERERKEKERVQKEIDKYNKAQAKKAKAFKDKTMADLLADEEDEKDDIKSGAIQDLFENEFRRVDRKRFTPPGLLGLTTKILSPLLAKGSKYNRQFFTKNVAPPGFDKMSLTQRNKAYSDYMGARQRGEVDAYGNKITNRGDGGGGSQQPIIPITQQTPKSQDDTEEEDFQLALAFRADGGRVPYEDGGYTGGIMDLETGRQMYFLGKLVKKATRAFKKIVKSPVGKIGMGIMAAKFAPALIGQYKAGSGLGGLFSKGLTFAKENPLVTSLAGGALAGLLQSKGLKDENQDGLDDETGLDIEAILKDPGGKGGLQGRFDYGSFKDGGMPAEEGMMNLQGMEMDFREDGGFVPIGKKERADDVPARLSKNEFVMTADAVRGAGDGDIDKGAEKMYNLMSKLEAENDQSQGLDGARKMFKTAQRLEEVL